MKRGALRISSFYVGVSSEADCFFWREAHTEEDSQAVILSLSTLSGDSLRVTTPLPRCAGYLGNISFRPSGRNQRWQVSSDDATRLSSTFLSTGARPLILRHARLSPRLFNAVKNSHSYAVLSHGSNGSRTSFRVFWLVWHFHSTSDFLLSHPYDFTWLSFALSLSLFPARRRFLSYRWVLYIKRASRLSGSWNSTRKKDCKKQ